MSWASTRTMTRSEDLTYCLMGLFSIDMPMLYGEGGRAFIRLQEQTIRKYDDHSIFAWRSPVAQGELLALRPASFAGSSNIVRSISSSQTSYSLTNKGVQLYVPIIETDVPGRVLAVLACHRIGRPEQRIALELVTTESHDYARRQWKLIDLNIYGETFTSKHPS